MMIENGCKTYKKTVKISIIRSAIQTLAYAFLGGFNGVIVSMMAIVRQIFLYQKKFTDTIVAVWILASAIINIAFANSLADLFPFVGTVQFTLMVKKQDTISLKYATFINTLIWSVYHIAHRTYVYLLFDVISTIIVVVRLKKGVKDE